MTRNQMRDLALQFGFKLKKQMPSGEEDLNPYVYDLMEALLRMKDTDSRHLQQEKRIKQLENQIEVATGALNYYLYGGSNYSKVARDALNEINQIGQKTQENTNVRL